MQVTRQDDWLTLELYAVLGDGRSAAVIGADGSVDWWAAPNMDSVPLFDRILAGEKGGRLSMTPAGRFTVERNYLPDSNVLEQVFHVAGASARVTSSLNSGISGRLPWSELAQRIEGLDGSVVFDVEFRPAERLDQATPWREKNELGDVLHIDGVLAALLTTADLERSLDEDGRVVARLVTQPGSRSLIALVAAYDEPLIMPPIATIDARIDRSDQAWREWAGMLQYEGPFRDAVRRSSLALKLLLFSPSGAIAAAATIGLPEHVGGKKNYDYRYAWVRDVAFTIEAFLRVGAVEEAKAAFSWMTATIRRHGTIRTMYALDGDIAPEQREIDLVGYRGSKPVLVGNKAREQLQLGVFGDVLETAALFVENGHALNLVTRRLLADLADQSADTWRLKDAGIWELEQQEHYTISKMGCWTALDRAVTLAGLEQIDGSRSERWKRERDRILEWIDANCWSERKQAYTLHAGTDRLDASIALAARFRFPRPERLALTRSAIVLELARGPLVYRYSGMEEEEGTFLACAFWLVEAFALLGEHEEARSRMEALLEATGGNLGLLTEQQQAGSATALGNMPQALSHLALIQAAFSIEQSTSRG